MTLIAVLDEAIVAVSASLTLALHAMPASWLVALGMVVIGLVLASAGMRASIRAALDVDGDGCAQVVSHGIGREHSTLLATTPRRPAGARGARSPGRCASSAALHG